MSEWESECVRVCVRVCVCVCVRERERERYQLFQDDVASFGMRTLMFRQHSGVIFVG